jgi:competence protein ComEA
MKKLLVPLLVLFSGHVFATPVNINTADAPTISASLAGIGMKKAEAIVADRAKNGPFKSVDDLKRVAGIGEKTVAVNRSDILLEDPKPAAPSNANSATPVAPAATPAAPAAPAKVPEVKK